MYIYGARGSILYGARVRRRVRTLARSLQGVLSLLHRGHFLSIKILPFPLLLVAFVTQALGSLRLQTQVRNTARSS